MGRVNMGLNVYSLETPTLETSHQLIERLSAIAQKPAADVLPSGNRQGVEELMANMGHLSARERNQLKRKAKAQAQARAAETGYVSREEEGPALKKQRNSKTVVTDQPQDGNKVRNRVCKDLGVLARLALVCGMVTAVKVGASWAALGDFWIPQSWGSRVLNRTLV
jgi:hypothetical protein